LPEPHWTGSNFLTADAPTGKLCRTQFLKNSNCSQHWLRWTSRCTVCHRGQMYAAVSGKKVALARESCVLEIWGKVENIAVHFSEALMCWRRQIGSENRSRNESVQFLENRNSLIVTKFPIVIAACHRDSRKIDVGLNRAACHHETRCGTSIFF